MKGAKLDLSAYNDDDDDDHDDRDEEYNKRNKGTNNSWKHYSSGYLLCVGY